MRNFLTGLLLTQLISFSLMGQGSLSLYNLYKTVPQANEMNPALTPGCKFFIAIPVISGINVNWQGDFALTDIVTRRPDDSLSIDLQKFLKNSKANNKLSLDANVNIFSFGFRVANSYFFLGASVTNQVGLSLSHDFLDLMINGNGTPGLLGKKIELKKQEQNQLSYAKLGLGYSQGFLSGKLSAGVRINLIKGVLGSDLDTRNAGYIYTDPNSYNITLNSGDMKYHLSGFDESKNGPINTTNATKLNNLGFGVDLGLLWKITDKWVVSGSVDDLGAIFWDAGNTNYFIKDKSFVYKGQSIDQINNLKAIGDSLKNLFEPEKSNNGYTQNLRTKIYLHTAYDFINGHELSFVTRNVFFRNSVINMSSVQYHKKFGNILDLSVAYSLFELQYSQLGCGFSLTLPGISIYAATDNIPGFFHPENAHLQNIAFGLNIIVGQTK